MTEKRRKEKAAHMMMWAMLTLPIREDWFLALLAGVGCAGDTLKRAA